MINFKNILIYIKYQLIAATKPYMNFSTKRSHNGVSLYVYHNKKSHSLFYLPNIIKIKLNNNKSFIAFTQKKFSERLFKIHSNIPYFSPHYANKHFYTFYNILNNNPINIDDIKQIKFLTDKT